ncbi:MAG: ABC transporter ATP-binding protein [Clostridia bacterium]|nr:ABC transporter ATP-binding protein [Clostridia bacterium]
MFEVKELSKSYGRVPVLSQISFSLPVGKIVGLLGPNGSGKTTLIKIAAGLLTPTSGTLLIDQKPVGLATKALVSYLPDRLSLPERMRVREALEYYADFFADFDLKRAEEMLQRLNVPLDRQLKALSKGMKEKLQLVLTMSRQAKLYLLDEPIGGVDPATRDYILETIINNYEPESTVIISTHLIADVEKVLDEFLFLKDGRIVLQDSVDNVRENQGKSLDALFREVFKC